MPEVDDTPTPFWSAVDGSVELYLGDVVDVLRGLPAKSVHAAVTSPPYWGLRDYGTGTWTGGDPACDHKRIVGKRTNDATVPQPGYKNGFRGSVELTDHRQEPVGQTCPLGCGAVRVGDRQLGSERSPDCGQLIPAGDGLFRRGNCAEVDWENGCHTCRMVLVFREVRRVLRDDGVLFLNYGDTYSSGNCGGETVREAMKTRGNKSGLPSGNLCGVPWRVALALQADGWVLRQDIIWHKPSPMPESVTNRCTKAHEYVFLLTKSANYFYDAEAIREPLKMTDEEYASMLASKRRQNSTKAGTAMEAGAGRKDDGFNAFISDDKGELYVPNGANKRSVWTVTSQGYPGAHYATFPPKLIKPMILAGTSAHGCCGDCGTPWRRVTRREKLTRERPNDFIKRTGEAGTGNSCGNTVAGVAVETLGWQPTCECRGELVKRKGIRLGYGSYHSHEADGVEYGLRPDGGPVSDPGEPTVELEATVIEYVSNLPLDEHPVVPCTVLDPFVGSATTAQVSLELGRYCIGVDLSEAYLTRNAVPRIVQFLQERGEGSRAVGGGMAREPKAVVLGEG